MIAKRIFIGLGIVAASVAAHAQSPVLGNTEAPYANIQNSVQIAGHTYGAGAVAYGPAGTPLVLSGSDLGDTGSVQFIAYKNGTPDPNVGPVNASPTWWSPTMIFVPVPAGAFTGIIQVKVEGKTSNGLPFIVTAGQYAASCPAGPSSSQLQIVTSSLHDGAIGQGYSVTLSAQGGTQAYTWSITNGSLPAGLSLNASTGVISGTPSAAVSQLGLTFEVTDSSSPHQADQAVLDLTIQPQQMTPSGVYSYSANYDGNGNVTQYTDTVMGQWNFTYDDFNRLESGSAVSGGSGDFTGQNLCFAYDSFGNRTAQNMQTASCPSQESSVSTTTYPNNQITGGLVGYDQAGNVTADSNSGNSYAYDAEGRVCAVKNAAIPGMPLYTGYLYDADGNRVAKGSITTMSCDPTTNGFQLQQNYVLGPSGEELSMLDGNNNWQRTNVYAGEKLVGTYDGLGLHYQLEDPLGTRRMQLSGSPSCLGAPETDIQSLPFGDLLYPFPDQYACATADDATPLHFTGKERDTESGNDYFGARYYTSSMGRFMSPDWSAKEEPVPYAKLDDPQSLNLYAYVRNNPLVRVDSDGHAFGLDDLVGALAGGAVGVGAEVIKDFATGQRITPGAIAGAAVGGAIVGEGIVNIPETLGGSAVAAAALKGAAQGAVSNLVQQGVDNATGDQKGFNGQSLAVSTVLGAATGGLASKVPDLKIPGISSGTGNMKAVAQGIATKIENGTASSMSLKTAVKGAIGGQVADAGRTVTGTGATAAATGACNANTGGACK